MVRHAGSPTRIMYVDVTLIRSKVKGTFRKLWLSLWLQVGGKAVHAGGDDRQPPCGAFLFHPFLKHFTRNLLLCGALLRWLKLWCCEVANILQQTITNASSRDMQVYWKYTSLPEESSWKWKQFVRMSYLLSFCCVLVTTTIGFLELRYTTTNCSIFSLTQIRYVPSLA